MKQTATILSTCIALLFLFSCTSQQQMATAQGSSKKPEFIDGITLGGGSNKVNINQKKQVYQNRKNGSIPEELESADQRGFAQDKIKEGKKRNRSLYTFIEEWYGTPYLFGGTSKHGIDCSAFTRELYGDVYNVGLMRTSIEQFSGSLFIPKTELKEGDLVFFKIHSKRISHVGVYLYDGKFVHASVSQGVVISDLSDAYWVRYYAGAGRVG